MLVSNEAKCKTFPGFFCLMRVNHHFHSNGFDLVSLQNRGSVEQLARKWPTNSHVSTEVLCRIFMLFPKNETYNENLPILFFLTVATKTNLRAVYVTVTCQRESWFFPRAGHCQSCFLLQPMILERHCQVLLYNLVHSSLCLTTIRLYCGFLESFSRFLPHSSSAFFQSMLHVRRCFSKRKG